MIANLYGDKVTLISLDDNGLVTVIFEDGSTGRYPEVDLEDLEVSHG